MTSFRILAGSPLLLWMVGAAGAGELRVVTTTPDLAAITRAVGGEAVEVTAIARGYQDPHYVEAKPSYMRRLSRADLLIYNGLELEIGWLPLLVQGSRNRRVLPGSDGILDASRGLAILEVPAGEVDRSMGDIHPQGNPHYALDPRNGLRISAAVAARLQRLAPERSEEFERGLAAFKADLAKRVRDWEERTRHLRGRKVVAFHEAFVGQDLRQLDLDLGGWNGHRAMPHDDSVADARQHICDRVCYYQFSFSVSRVSAVFRIVSALTGC